MRTVLALVLILFKVAAPWAAEPEGTPASRAALRACNEAADADDAAGLDAAVALAEEAVAAKDDDALAHFALFCALGKRMRMRGASVLSLFELNRLRREVDRTLVLAPDFPDAMVGKANLLLDAPRLVGGDPAAAERLLRRALEIDPDHLSARRDLARALDRQGDRAGARRQARQALRDAQHRGDADDVRAARELLESLE